nr:MAG TPA: hypothetical protein [Caudoviricetes sp.]
MQQLLTRHFWFHSLKRLLSNFNSFNWSFNIINMNCHIPPYDLFF